MDTRNDFVTAYAAAQGCTAQHADTMLRGVEIAYGERENAALRQQLDTMGGQEIMAESNERRRLQAEIDRLGIRITEATEIIRSAGVDAPTLVQGVRDLCQLLRGLQHAHEEAMCACLLIIDAQVGVKNSPVTELLEAGRYEEAIREYEAERNPRFGHVLKPTPDSEDYVHWSGVCDMPSGVWTRPEALAAGIPETWLERADRLGTSWPSGGGGWDNDVFIADQMGILRRKDLGTYARLYLKGEHDKAYALLEPFEDEERQ